MNQAGPEDDGPEGRGTTEAGGDEPSASLDAAATLTGALLVGVATLGLYLLLTYPTRSLRTAGHGVTLRQDAVLGLGVSIGLLLLWTLLPRSARSISAPWGTGGRDRPSWVPWGTLGAGVLAGIGLCLWATRLSTSPVVGGHVEAASHHWAMGATLALGMVIYEGWHALSEGDPAGHPLGTIGVLLVAGAVALAIHGLWLLWAGDGLQAAALERPYHVVQPSSFDIPFGWTTVLVGLSVGAILGTWRHRKRRGPGSAKEGTHDD